MSFTDGKPFIATEKHLQTNWLCGKRGEYFRCFICGHKFQVGDTVRWQYTNNITGASGNPLVCSNCDGPNVIAKWKELCDLWKSDKMWFFRRHIE